MRRFGILLLVLSVFSILAQWLCAQTPPTRRHLQHQDTAPQAQTTGPEEVLYTFHGLPDGRLPNGLIFDSSGNLYGTTQQGGAANFGTVFELSPDGHGGWNEIVLYSFQGGSDGKNPLAGVIFDSLGNLYGTTAGSDAGCWVAGCGTVFKLSPDGSGGWTETALHTFQAGSDGVFPESGLVFDKAGNLYGTTLAAGDMGCPDSLIGCGTVFKLSPDGSGGWTNTTLHAFHGGGDGSTPTSDLIFDEAGNLYGTTRQGGTHNFGTVFELSPNSSGTWTETVLYRFLGGGDGGDAQGGLTFDQSDNLYGTTQQGGAADFGTVFELSPDGHGGWNETVLYSFQYGNDGLYPRSGVFIRLEICMAPLPLGAEP